MKGTSAFLARTVDVVNSFDGGLEAPKKLVLFFGRKLLDRRDDRADDVLADRTPIGGESLKVRDERRDLLVEGGQAVGWVGEPSDTLNPARG